MGFTADRAQIEGSSTSVGDPVVHHIFFALASQLLKKQIFLRRMARSALTLIVRLEPFM